MILSRKKKNTLMTLIILSSGIVVAVLLMRRERLVVWLELHTGEEGVAFIQPNFEIYSSNHPASFNRDQIELGHSGLSIDMSVFDEQLQIDDGRAPLAIRTSRGSALIVPNEDLHQLHHNDIVHNSNCCDRLRTPSGRIELYSMAEQSFQKAVEDRIGQTLGGDEEFWILFYIYNVVPEMSLWQALWIDESEWHAYVLALTRKTQLERAIERGVKIVVSEQAVGILRSGSSNMGNAVDCLVYSCHGHLMYSMLVESASIDDSEMLAIQLFRATSSDNLLAVYPQAEGSE